MGKEFGVPGTQYLIQSLGRFPFDDGTVNLILAYSVFTHLPEFVHLHWLRELHRVAKQGCVFVLTVEPPRFIEFCAQIEENDPSPWHRTLKKHVGDWRELLARINGGEYVYLPTGGGDHLPEQVYGDCVVPYSYIAKNWSKFFAVREYIDNPQRFWQAVCVLQKP